MSSSMAISSSPFTFFIFLSTVAVAASAQTFQNITRGTTFTPLGQLASWPSPSGDFAFGFFPVTNYSSTSPASSSSSSSSSSLFLLGVWFNKTSPATLVWAANRNQPLRDGCTCQFTGDGQLSLKDNDGQEVWNPYPSSNASQLALLDSGNLILSVDAAAGLPWKSFDNPTDTLLPSQVMDQGNSIRAKLTDFDYSDGRFNLINQQDRNLVMYTLELPMGDDDSAYWASNTVSTGEKLIYNASGSVYFSLTNKTLSPIQVLSGPTFSPDDFYQRLTIDYDGVLRQYIYPKETNNNVNVERKWNVNTFIPEDPCERMVERLTGSGACGFNSYCAKDTTTDQGFINCLCPPHYSFIDPDRKYKGCMPDFAPQSCNGDQAAAGTSDGSVLTPMANTNWTMLDYAYYTNVNQDQCIEYCLDDCFCAVATYNEKGECWKKKMPLSNGIMGNNIAGIALIKVSNSRRNGSSLLPPEIPLKSVVVKKDRSTLIIVGATILGSSAFLNMILITSILTMFFCFRSSTMSLHKMIEADASMSELISLRTFTYRELENATNGFSEEIGRGSFGIVYKGALAISNMARSIAVKRLDRLLQESDKEFVAEVRTIGQTHHKNLVMLIGFCNEGAHRILVYEYMRNGSLTSFLFGGGRGRASWNLRIQIAQGIARGLLYLHEDCRNSIIHCDIKPQNVLLDDNMVARISDFGLSKLMDHEQTRTITDIRGTRGYVAPEWFKSTAITKKVDVYSFGVMLLEIICCRRNLEKNAEEEEEREDSVLIYWACDCYRDGKLALLVQNDEEAMMDMRMVKRFVTVAMWCIQEDPSLRPSMIMVNQMMEGSIPVRLPPDSSTYFAAAIQSSPSVES